MTEHDYRQHQLGQQRSLKECRMLQPGQYLLTGSGSNIQPGDCLRVSLKGSNTLELRLRVEEITPLLNNPHYWSIKASGPVFSELYIHRWQVQCDGCGSLMELEFAADKTLAQDAQTAAAENRLHELGWVNRAGRHLCRHCQKNEA